MMTGGGGGGVACGACLLAVESGSGNGSRVSVRVDGIKYCKVWSSVGLWQLPRCCYLSFPLTLL